MFISKKDFRIRTLKVNWIKDKWKMNEEKKLIRKDQFSLLFVHKLKYI